MDYLKKGALTLDMALELPEGSGKRRLVFAPTKYLDAMLRDAIAGCLESLKKQDEPVPLPITGEDR